MHESCQNFMKLLYWNEMLNTLHYFCLDHNEDTEKFYIWEADAFRGGDSYDYAVCTQKISKIRSFACNYEVHCLAGADLKVKACNEKTHNLTANKIYNFIETLLKTIRRWKHSSNLYRVSPVFKSWNWLEEMVLSLRRRLFLKDQLKIVRSFIRREKY